MKMPDEDCRNYLFVAIDRATRWVYRAIYPDQTEVSSTCLLQEVYRRCPVRMRTILTDNGTQFTDRFTSRERVASGQHIFDRECTTLEIEHRLIPPRLSTGIEGNFAELSANLQPSYSSKSTQSQNTCASIGRMAGKQTGIIHKILTWFNEPDIPVKRK